MKRAGMIDALILRSNLDFENVKKSYDKSLHERHVSEDLKISIKNIFENLRSCLGKVRISRSFLPKLAR